MTTTIPPQKFTFSVGVVVNEQKASFQNMKPKDRSCLLIGSSVLSSIVNNSTCCKLHFSTGGRGGGGSEREKLLLVWDSFLQSQEIEVEYSMSSTDDIMNGFQHCSSSASLAGSQTLCLPKAAVLLFPCG